MKYKFLVFMKKWFHNQGDCCPQEEWDKFINEFAIDERETAIAFTNKLIEEKYIAFIAKENGKYLAVSGVGAERIKRNLIEVTL